MRHKKSPQVEAAGEMDVSGLAEYLCRVRKAVLAGARSAGQAQRGLVRYQAVRVDARLKTSAACDKRSRIWHRAMQIAEASANEKAVF